MDYNGALFQCYPYMKDMYKQRMAPFFDIVTPKEGELLTDEQKKYPVVHVDAAKHLELILDEQPALQKCVQAREEELDQNIAELGSSWDPWIPKTPGKNFVEARFQMDSAVMYSRSKKQREFVQCAVYLYLSLFGLPSCWITLLMLALYEGGDGLLNFASRCYGTLDTQLTQLIETGRF